MFGTFGRLLPFGQWVFDKSRVQRKIRLKSHLSCKAQSKSNENQNINQKEKSFFLEIDELTRYELTKRVI